MAIKHDHTAVSNEIIQSDFWNADHTGEITDANHGIRTIANAHSHAHLSNVTSDQHHNKSHSHDGIDGSGTIAHSDTTGKTADDHHNESHTLASHSTKAHTELTGVTSDQHHPQLHNAVSHSDIASTGAQIDGAVAASHVKQHALNSAADHTGEITDAQHGVRTTVNAHAHGNLSGIGTDDHHAQSHNMASHTDDYSEGEGIDISVGNVISGEDASTINKGIASFDTNHFTVTAGSAALNTTVVTAINQNTGHRGGDGSDHSLLANKTSYASISAYGFIMQDAETDAGTYADASLENTTGLTKNCYASIQLPHGAVVTSAIVIATGGTWYLSRSNDEDPPDVMASAGAGVADGTINFATIDNNNHSYNFMISLPAGGYLTAARITYTTDYD